MVFRLLIFALAVVLLAMLLRYLLHTLKTLRESSPTDTVAVPPDVEPLHPGNYTVEDRLAQVGARADARLQPWFHRAGVPYPPERIALLAFKQEKILDLYAAGWDQEFQLVRSFPILAASGAAGPKLREGDRQVPEGFYEIESLNPNSRYHLALRLNYPSPVDLIRAGEDDRPVESLGGDIMIHGRAASVGCLAIGDAAAEELFVLVARTGLDRVQVILAPCDFRGSSKLELPPTAPAWTGELHEQIREALKNFPLHSAAGK
jgi:hypothetical protein